EGELLLEPVRSLGDPVSSAASGSGSATATFKDSAAERQGWRSVHSPVDVVRVVACACVEAVGAAAIANDSAVLNLTSEAWAINKLHGAWVSVRNIVSQT